MVDWPCGCAAHLAKCEYFPKSPVPDNLSIKRDAKRSLRMRQDAYSPLALRAFQRSFNAKRQPGRFATLGQIVTPGPLLNIHSSNTHSATAKNASVDLGKLSVSSIGKSYGKRRVLQDISLNVSRGEIVGLLGPNGAGKTVCFYAIVGIVAVDIGEIILGSTAVTHLPMSDRAILGMGYLPQEASIFRGMTVAENISAVLELFNADRDIAATKLEALLSEFRIAHVRDTSAISLSGGERRRCEIARAVAANPSILLLDEPFAGIDPLSIADITMIIRDLKRRNIGVLITDHNVHAMVDLIDRAYVIYDGRMLFQGSPAALIADSQVRHFYLGDNFAV